MKVTEVQTYSLSYLVSAPFASVWSEDNQMALMTEKGIHILEVIPDPKSTSPALRCHRYWLKIDTTLPTCDVKIDSENLLWCLNKKDAYNTVLDTAVLPKITKSAPIVPAVKSVVWSPRGILPSQRCIMSVLTDMGSLVFYHLNFMEWKPICSVSDIWLQCCQKSWPEDIGTNVKVVHAELLKRVNQVKITSMCWNKQAYKDRSGVFFTGLSNGNIVIWRVQNMKVNNETVTVTYVSEVDSQMSKIVALHWHFSTYQSGILMAGDVKNVFKCFKMECTDSSTAFKSIASHVLWDEDDRLKINYLDSWEYKTGILIALIKEAFLIVFCYDDCVNNTYPNNKYGVFRCSDTTITGLARLSDDMLMVSSRSGRLTSVSIKVDFKEYKVSLSAKFIENYLNLSHMGCFGIGTSINNVICTVVLSVNQVYDHLILREPSQIVLCTLMDPQQVIATSTQRLNKLWDCFEILRVHTLQKSMLPVVESQRTTLDTMSIEKLTHTLWAMTFVAAVEDDPEKQTKIKEIRNEVETLVLSCHLFKLVAKLVMYAGVKELTEFHHESLGLLKKWLRSLSSFNAEYGTTLLAANTLLEEVEALGNVVCSTEICGVCKSDVPSFTSYSHSVCGYGHRIPRCSLTLVQVYELPYFSCSQCGALAHRLGVEECGDWCIFCDGVLRMNELLE